MKKELFLEVQDLYLTDAVNENWRGFADKGLLYIKHLSGEREIAGKIIPKTNLLVGQQIIDVSKLDDFHELRKDYFNFTLASYENSTFELVNCIYDKDNKQIILADGGVTQDVEYFFKGFFHEENMINITKNLRDK